MDFAGLTSLVTFRIYTSELAHVSPSSRICSPEIDPPAFILREKSLSASLTESQCNPKILKTKGCPQFDEYRTWKKAGSISV